MKTIRLIYPDHVSGGLDTYYLGARLMAQILPDNPAHEQVYVNVLPPDGREKPVSDGIYAKDEVLGALQDAYRKLDEAQPDRVITVGGNCMVSLVPFDYLHAKYGELGIIWIDAHPDVSVPANGYPNAHAMVLGSLLGLKDAPFSAYLRAPAFSAASLLYVGLQGLHDYQRRALDTLHVKYTVQTESLVSTEELKAFAGRFKRVLVHFDIDVLDPKLFHATYFANPELTGDGSGGGRMTLEELASILPAIEESTEIAGFTVAEYLPFEARRLQQLFSKLQLFKA